MSGFVSAYSTDITVAAPSAPLEPLRILSINCGGLTSKLHLLLALLHSSDPDVVCLQEVGPQVLQRPSTAYPIASGMVKPCREEALPLLSIPDASPHALSPHIANLGDITWAWLSPFATSSSSPSSTYTCLPASLMWSGVQRASQQ